jgi:hypothetical protein
MYIYIVMKSESSSLILDKDLVQFIMDLTGSS